MPSSPATTRAGPGRPSPPGSPTPTRTRCPASPPPTAAPRRPACTRVSEPRAPARPRLPATSRGCRRARGSRAPHGVLAGGVTETEGQSRTCRLTSWHTQAPGSQVKENSSPEDRANPLPCCDPALLGLSQSVHMHWPGRGWVGWGGRTAHFTPKPSPQPTPRLPPELVGLYPALVQLPSWPPVYSTG